MPHTPAFAEETTISDALVVKTQSTPIETEILSEETCTVNSIALTNQAAELPIERLIDDSTSTLEALAIENETSLQY